MSLIIREMQMEDIAQVQHVAKTSWHHTYDGIIPFEIQENFLKAAYNDEMMQKRLEHSLIIVAVEDDKIVGFANFSPVREEGKVELAAIYLYPEAQGKGIGTMLLEKGIEKSLGVKAIFINVEKENLVGKNFYDAKGFEVVSEFDDDFDGHILKTTRMVLNV
ncbi:GNAT family N-acetyltransferase [Pseudalkalibacillus sp. SCS-8]|uniref:GNAT family N-acetyltransferase n=1 Tax=Pseudalkalibacillus nanhaiensis TaxID=3115291 RepID=UPI0032DB9202